MKKDDLVKEAQKRFKQAMDAESDNRERAIEDFRFVALGEQWNHGDKMQREADGRPCMVVNKCAGVSKQVVGDARQNKPSIKIRPADNQASQEVAELLTGLIRNIENSCDAEAAYDTGIECAVNGGWGYWRVRTDYADEDVFDQDIVIDRIVNPFTVYLDPRAKKADKSDAKWGFITEYLTKDDFEDQYPNVDITSWSEKGNGETERKWFDGENVRVAEYYYIEPVKKTLWQLLTVSPEGTEDYDTVEAFTQDVIEMDGRRVVMTENGPAIIVKERTVNASKVMWCKLAGSEIIEGPIEQAGKFVPIVYCAGDESWIEGEPILKSAFFHAKDSNRLYNWAVSNSVESLALSPKQPFIGTPKMFENHEAEWDEASRKPRMRLHANFDNGQLPQRQPFSLPDNGSYQMLMQASDDIKSTTGLYDASLGAQGNEKSGKAIIARQRESDVATFLFHDNQARAIKFTGRILLSMIPKIYDAERVVRILNRDGSEGWAQINKKVPDPMSPTGYKIINDLTIGKYDVVVDTGPNYATKRIEAAEGMVQFMTAAPQTAPVLLPRIAKNADWPEADEIAEELQSLVGGPQQDPQAQMMMQQQQQMMQMQAQQEMGKQQVEAAKAQIELTTMQEKLKGVQLDNVKKEIEIQRASIGE